MREKEHLYPTEDLYNPEHREKVEAQKRRILGELARHSISHMELLCLRSEDTPLERHEIIDTALHELQQSGQIHKIHTVTGQGNALIAYTLTTSTPENSL